MKTKWLRLGAVLFAALPVLALPGRAADADPGAPGTGWKTFTDPEGRFSILMPAAPEMQNGSGPQDAARPGYTSRLYLAKENNNLYIAGFMLYDSSVYDPSATPEKIEAELAADRDNFNRELDAHVTSQQRRKIGDYPALEFTSSSEEADFSGLMVLVGARCYVAVATYHTSHAPPEVGRFFSSFKLLSP